MDRSTAAAKEIRECIKGKFHERVDLTVNVEQDVVLRLKRAHTNALSSLSASRELHWFHLYGSIDQVRGTANIAGSERICDVDCAVVKIERPDNVRTLWIDPKTNFILKENSTATTSLPTGEFTIHSATIFTLAHVLPSVDQQLFSFDPQKLNAKPRQELQQQANRNSVGTHAANFTLSSPGLGDTRHAFRVVR